jgi:AraC-like DNA-binding protein
VTVCSMTQMTAPEIRIPSELQGIARPVAGVALDYATGTFEPGHSHPRAQLLYASEGVMSVVTTEGAFVVSAPRALWIPPGLTHEVQFKARVSLRTVYIDARECPHMPQQCRLIEVSALLHALMCEATRVPIEYPPGSRGERIMTLLLEEVASMRVAPFCAPMPEDERLVRVCRAILHKPAQSVTVEDCALAAGMGRRTFTRNFRRETGMTFVEWRQHVRLIEALARLTSGSQVTSVAYDVGYQTPSAFAAVFRRMFGTTPTEYFQNQLNGEPHSPSWPVRPHRRARVKLANRSRTLR